MNENTNTQLDIIFKRYLKIMRPYLLQLSDPEVIDICNAWIERLSKCTENEKTTRNNYIFSLCYQLAKGVLYEPFLNYPTETELQTCDEILSEISSTQSESIIQSPSETNTKIICDKKTNFDTENMKNELDDYVMKQTDISNEENSINLTFLSHKSTCKLNARSHVQDNSYECRANNLIMRLRELKNQNMLLQKELQLQSIEPKCCLANQLFIDDNGFRVDHATSTYNLDLENIANLKSIYLSKLQEVEDTKNGLLEKLNILQTRLEHYNDIKNKEIEDMAEDHKLEIINVKCSVRDETKYAYEKKIDELKEYYENKVRDDKQNMITERRKFESEKDEAIKEKEKVIELKDKEIARLENQIKDQNLQFHALLNKFLDKSEDEVNNESIRLKAQQIESRLNKIEKSKYKSAKAYESKLVQLQKEKQLAECSLQLQLVKQRTQVINEMTDENQMELATALSKLEAKYKDIVASIQATAIQRRIQDQALLESALQVVCGTQNTLCSNSLTSDMQQLYKTMQNRNTVANRSMDSETRPIVRHNKVNNESLGQESVLVGYCLNSEQLEGLYGKVNIPQRDVEDGPSKKTA